MYLKDDGPLFLKIPDGDIANILMFYDVGFHADFQLYHYWTFLPHPSDSYVEEIFDCLLNSRSVSSNSRDSQYVIHQSNASWIGHGLAEYREQLYNQEERYEAVSDDYNIDIYKNEMSIFVTSIAGGNYLILNADPWVHSGRNQQFRDFDIHLLLDGLPLYNTPVETILKDLELNCETGHQWNPPSQYLSGNAVSDIEVEIFDKMTDDMGYTEYVVCENPLYQQTDFLDRILPRQNNIVSEYNHILAKCDSAYDVSETANVENIKITGYDKISRGRSQNIAMEVSFKQ